MTLENLEQFRLEYQAGKAALERGNYREAVERLKSAIALVPPNSIRGGDAKIWLVTAYEAVGQRTEAIALCKELSRHPNLETRKQSKRLLYILEAPELARPADWLTEIPDLSSLADADDRFRQGSTAPSSSPAQKPPKTPEPIDLTQVNTKENKFIWVALIAAGLVLLALGWLSF